MHFEEYFELDKHVAGVLGTIGDACNDISEDGVNSVEVVVLLTRDCEEAATVGSGVRNTSSNNSLRDLKKKSI